jgi:hypothetical protein
MIRRIGYVEQIDWEENTCKIRIPNLDGMAKDEYGSEYLRMLLPNRPEIEDLQDADIPYHMQGLRVHDVVYVLDSEEPNDNYVIVGFFGGIYGEEDT